jgi:hypothetical protein
MEWPVCPIHTTLAAVNTVHAWSLETQAVLHRLKKTEILPSGEAHRLDVVSRQHYANAIEGQADKQQTSN